MTTMTRGSIHAIELFRHAGDASPDQLLRLAASLDQVSTHELASTLVGHAREKGLRLSPPTDVVQDAAYGIRGCVEGHTVALGTSYWVDRTSSAIDEVRRVQAEAARTGCTNIFVAIDGVTCGAILVETAFVWPTTQWSVQPWGFYA